MTVHDLNKPRLWFLVLLPVGLAWLFLFYVGAVTLPDVCGKQEWPVCQQQWLAAVGPAIALLFAGYGALQVRKQIEQGQVGSVATQRSLLRDELERLYEVRDELDQWQRDFEAVETDFPVGSQLPPSTNDKDLLRIQVLLDTLNEYIVKLRQEPYVSHLEPRRHRYWAAISERAEIFRAAWEPWAKGQFDDELMIARIHDARVLSVADIEGLRHEIGGTIDYVRRSFAALSDRKAAPVQPAATPLPSEKILARRAAAARTAADGAEVLPALAHPISGAAESLGRPVAGEVRDNITG